MLPIHVVLSDRQTCCGHCTQTFALMQLYFVPAFILQQGFTNKHICYQLSKHLHTHKEKKGSPDPDRKFLEFGRYICSSRSPALKFPVQCKQLP